MRAGCLGLPALKSSPSLWKRGPHLYSTTLLVDAVLDDSLDSIFIVICLCTLGVVAWVSSIEQASVGLRSIGRKSFVTMVSG